MVDTSVDVVVDLDTSYNITGNQSWKDTRRRKTILPYQWSCVVVAAAASGAIVGLFVAVDVDAILLLQHRISGGTTLSIVPVMFPNLW